MPRLAGSWHPGGRAPTRVGLGLAGYFADWRGVAVLLKIYAHRIDGQSDAANKRITNTLGIQDPARIRVRSRETKTASRHPECQVRGTKPGGRSA